MALNTAQREAVEHQDGPMLVLAGAGSGKTRVITQRIGRLLERGVPARAILALTFTNKAAEEMRERVEKVVGGPARAKDLTISTFHSFGLMVLGHERKAVGGAFTIFDQGDSVACLREIMRELKLDKRFDLAAIGSRISLAKNAFQRPEDLPDSEDPYEEVTKLVYPKYEAALKRFSAFDFDDLVCGVVRIFNERPDVRERWQQRYRYVLVDEYQDTNQAQFQLLRAIASGHNNVCAVGDDDQSIYAWRGADIRNILAFEDQFAGAKVVKLEENYRSTTRVLEVANAVISKKRDQRHKKTLFSSREGTEKVKHVVTPTPETEAAWVASLIRGLVKDQGVSMREIAVLYRSNSQAKLIEENLRTEGIAYRMIGGQQFFDKKEVKDTLAYLKLALNRDDEISLRRVINYPSRGIGDASIDKLALVATARGWTLWQAIERIDAIDEVSESARQGCKLLERIMGELRKDLIIDRIPPAMATRKLVERIGLNADIDEGSQSNIVAARRKANIESLFATLGKRNLSPDGDRESSLSAFLRALTLKFADEEQTGAAVTLSTLHGAKGLEFGTVFLIGCEEGYLPHTRTIDAKVTDAVPTDIEEERRLFYVGITRAKNTLYLSRCRARALRAKAVPRTESRFFADIPEDLLEMMDVREAPKPDTKEMLANASNFLSMLDAIGK